MTPRLLLIVLLALPLTAQKKDPVGWRLELTSASAAPGATILAKFTATIDPGWHLYAPTVGPGGPNPTLISLSPAWRMKLHEPKPIIKYDPNFKMNVESYEKAAVFLLEIQVPADAKPGKVALEASGRYQACSEVECLRPVKKTETAELLVNPGARTLPISIPAGYIEVPVIPIRTAAPVPETALVIGGGKAAAAPEDESLLQFVFVAFGFGLAAIFTPCVFPMIPITMSYFLKRQGVTRSQSISQAALFCLGIIVLFTGIGLLTAAVLGPFGVVQLGANPWVNLFIAVVFLAFGLSLLGAFEITLPSGMLTKLNQASDGGGIFGTMLMGLTFSLTSFACVGPFVGPLLAASVQGGGYRPAIGMSSFAAGLSAPFFLLAVFPSFLTRMPRSGGWLPRVKMVLGFVILAVMFKYLSTVDQVMHTDLLTRERFLAIWVVLFAMPGLYLFGLLKMEGIDANERVGVTRALVGAAFLAFALSLIPGMFGARLGELDAYIPAPVAGVSGGGSTTSGPQWMKDDYQGALAKARAENKPLFVNFTGYACTNCKWMKANMFPRPEIQAALQKFVLVDLYIDGTDAKSEENQKLYDSRINSASIPYYVIYDTNEKEIAHFEGQTRDSAVYLEFLNAPI
jgi:thiol:disulfide interchange protein DsbD